MKELADGPAAPLLLKPEDEAEVVACVESRPAAEDEEARFIELETEFTELEAEFTFSDGLADPTLLKPAGDTVALLIEALPEPRLADELAMFTLVTGPAP